MSAQGGFLEVDTARGGHAVDKIGVGLQSGVSHRASLSTRSLDSSNLKGAMQKVLDLDQSWSR